MPADVPRADNRRGQPAGVVSLSGQKQPENGIDLAGQSPENAGMDTKPETVPLPRYRSHKVVQAALVTSASVIVNEKGEEFVRLFLAVDGRPAAVDEPASWLRHCKEGLCNNAIGGYYVRYEDGYASWCPAAPFDLGYVRCGDDATTQGGD